MRPVRLGLPIYFSLLDTRALAWSDGMYLHSYLERATSVATVVFHGGSLFMCAFADFAAA